MNIMDKLKVEDITNVKYLYIKNVLKYEFSI